VRGPEGYENWRRFIEGAEPHEAYEFPIFTDARIVGEYAEQSPYQFFNPVVTAPIRLKRGIVARVQFYKDEEVSFSETYESVDGSYHGGGLTDELAAFVSLVLGVRAKPGDWSRRFHSAKDRGRPIGSGYKQDPTLLLADSGAVIPLNDDGYNLVQMELLTTYTKLTPQQAIVLVKSARLYQDGLWIAEAEPELAWLMLVSAVETVAASVYPEELSPEEVLKRAKPPLFEQLASRNDPELLRVVSEQLAPTLQPTKKFVDFLLRFLPPAPSPRPSEWFQVRWSKSALRDTLSTIYGHRSKALHAGTPFPQPMCDRAARDDSTGFFAERPYAGKVQIGETVWVAEDYPMYLHTFAYVVRLALIGWWKSLVGREA